MINAFSIYGIPTHQTATAERLFPSPKSDLGMKMLQNKEKRKKPPNIFPTFFLKEVNKEVIKRILCDREVRLTHKKMEATL